MVLNKVTQPDVKRGFTHKFLPACVMCILLLSALRARSDQFGDFAYKTVGTNVTITAYTGAGGDVVIPPSIVGYPVTCIGTSAFRNCSSLWRVTIPEHVTVVGSQAFRGCRGLAVVVFPDGLQVIGDYAFYYCTSLQTVTFPASVTQIGVAAFDYCQIPRGVFFLGNAPSVFKTFASWITFPPTLYYRPGTSGWADSFDNCQTLLWNAEICATGPESLRTGDFVRFDIAGTANIPIGIETCTNLLEGAWVRLLSTNLVGGSLTFSNTTPPDSSIQFFRIAAP
jgi:hypothetical protein